MRALTAHEIELVSGAGNHQPQPQPGNTSILSNNKTAVAVGIQAGVALGDRAFIGNAGVIQGQVVTAIA